MAEDNEKMPDAAAFASNGCESNLDKPSRTSKRCDGAYANSDSMAHAACQVSLRMKTLEGRLIGTLVGGSPLSAKAERCCSAADRMTPCVKPINVKTRARRIEPIRAEDAPPVINRSNVIARYVPAIPRQSADTVSFPISRFCRCPNPTPAIQATWGCASAGTSLLPAKQWQE
jgi:hypothetical protein